MSTTRELIDKMLSQEKNYLPDNKSQFYKENNSNNLDVKLTNNSSPRVKPSHENIKSLAKNEREFRLHNELSWNKSKNLEIIITPEDYRNTRNNLSNSPTVNNDLESSEEFTSKNDAASIKYQLHNPSPLPD